MVTRQIGFSAIEMLAVLAVFGILAAMAIPSYQSKIVREQIAAAIPLADTAKEPISAYRKATEAFPENNKEAGLPDADKIVSNHIRALVVEDGVIHMTFGNNAHGLLKNKILSIRPAVVEVSPVVPIAWVCGNAAVPDKMVVKDNNKTDIPNAYLPFGCKQISPKK
ncbi:MAG: pilin [Sulfurimicrobium sp.]|nr:pilin [Sulfurimicrobium sp.]